MRLTLRLRRVRDDEGSSLIELLVGIALMAVFGAIFSGAIFMMTNSSKTAASVTETSTRLSTAFVKLDRTARYAAAFSPPSQSGGNWVVEFRTTNTGSEVCTQLRVDKTSQQLQSRTWSVVGGAATGVSAWVPVALGITNGDVVTASADRPLPFVGSTGGSARYPSLTVSLVAVSGDASTTSMSVTTYPAVNSTSANSALAPLVCQEAGTRP